LKGRKRTGGGNAQKNKMPVYHIPQIPILYIPFALTNNLRYPDHSSCCDGPHTLSSS